MLVITGKVQKWGDKGYIIYIPKEHQEKLAKYHGKEIIVIIFTIGEQTPP